MSQARVYGKFTFKIKFAKAWSWNTLIMETFFRKFAATKRGKHTSKKRRFGTFSFRLCVVSKLCMTGRFYTET